MGLQTERARLMQHLTQERERLERTINTTSDAKLSEPGLDGGWSAKDAMAHLVFWEGSMLDRIRRASAGERIERPERTPEEWDTFINQRNDDAYAQARDRSPDDVRSAFAASYQEVLDTLAALTDAQIFHPDGISANLGFNVVDLIAGDTYEHYSEHGDAIRNWLASK